jgi:G3E family GTPase
MSEAADAGNPLMKKIELDTLVTVVDCSTFLRDYATKQPLAARPELGDGGNMRPVVDLLVEQVECADFVILNKTDLLDDDKVQQLQTIIATLNPLATVITSQHGQVRPRWPRCTLSRHDMLPGGGGGSTPLPPPMPTAMSKVRREGYCSLETSPLPSTHPD